MSLTLTEQNSIARALQDNVPFVHEPFERVARDLSLDPDAVLSQLAAWRDERKLREISGVIEGSAVGYDSALVAAHVPDGDIDRVAAVVSTHPTVTHNYRRDHHFNLWFTIAVPDPPGLGPTLDAIARTAHVERLQPLRRTATYKIGINFDLETLQSSTSATGMHAIAPIRVAERERRLIRALQTPLPIVGRPFRSLAATLDLDEDALLAFGREHLGGALRRYVATFRHRALGVRANGMIVWNVPAASQDAVGQTLAHAPEVTHCYARNAIAGFPYTLYSMIHGADEATCRAIASSLAQRVGVADYRILFSTHEYKKCRLRYFLPELDEWWERAAVAA